MITVKGHKFDVDILDVDDSERIVDVIRETESKISSLQESDGSIESTLKLQAETFEILKMGLTSTLGEDAPTKIFGDKRNLKTAREAWDDLIDGLGKQYEDEMTESIKRRETRAEKWGAGRIEPR